MKKLFILLFAFTATFLQAQISNLSLQASHAEGATKALLDNKRDLLVTFGYKDNTLKFWNKNSAQLYKTIDLTGYASDFAINDIEGKTYALTQNTIYIYDNTTFEELAQYPLGKIYSIDFHKTTPTEGLLLFYAEDQNGQKAMYGLNEETGEFINIPLPDFPGKGEPSHFEFTRDSKFLWVETNYLEYYLYDASLGTYREIDYDPGASESAYQEKPIAMFDNGDVLFLKYTADNFTELSRKNVNTGKVVWTYRERKENFSDSNAWAGYQVVIEKDQQSFWIAAGESTFLEINATSGYILGKIYREDFKNAMVSDGKYLFAQSGLNLPYAKFQRYESKPVLEFGDSIFEPGETIAYVGKDAFEIITGDFDGATFSLLNNASTSHLTKYKPTYKYDGSQGFLIADLLNKDVYSIPRNSESIKVFQRGQPDSFKDIIENLNGVDNVDYLPESKMLATMGGSAVRVVDMIQGKVIYLKMIPSSTPLGNDGISLAPNTSHVAFITYNVAGPEFVDYRIEYVDYQSQQLLWKKAGRYSSIKHIENGAKIFALNIENNMIEILDAKTGAQLKSYKLDNDGFDTTTRLSPDERYLFVTGANVPPTIYDAKKGTKLKSLPFQDIDFFEPSFVGSNLIMKASNGSIKLYNVLTGKEAVRIYIFLDNEWIAHTPDGYFDGSQGAWERVAFAKGNTFLPLASVFQKFYTPRLLNKIFKEENIDRDIEIDALNPAPTVAITYKEGARNLTVEDDTNTITTAAANAEITLVGNAFNDMLVELRLYHNGKLVTNNACNLVVEDDVTPSGDQKTFQLTLLEGANNFIAIAVNSQNTESLPESIVVTYKPTQQEMVKPQGIQAHIMIVGIDQYKNAKYNLNYAVADATSFQQDIQKGVANITSQSHIYSVKNDQAVRENILSKFAEVASKANPQDIFIFYYAGHGVVAEEGNKDFFLVPHDVTQLYGNDGALVQKGISASELKKIAAGIPAQKQLYILDACQSAGALTTIATRGAAEEKAIAQLARSTGTHWLTASGSEQFATEFDELGHGVFTYALLEALSGKADSGDNRITVNEIKAYIESRVPEISEKYKGNPQYPSSFGFGQDFPVAIKN